MVVNQFVTCIPLGYIDSLLAGLRNPSRHHAVDWDCNPQFVKFKDSIVQQEDEIEAILCSVTYNLDDENTLTLVTGGDRPEKVNSDISLAPLLIK